MNIPFQKNDSLHILDEIIIDRIPSIDIHQLAGLNRNIFNEERIIMKPDQPDLMILTARYRGELVGFKIGYALDQNTYYSAKGCTKQGFRRMGIATKLLGRMILEVKLMGYEKLTFDTLPSLYKGMFELGIKEGFQEAFSTWNGTYNTEQVRLERKL